LFILARFRALQLYEVRGSNGIGFQSHGNHSLTCKGSYKKCADVKSILYLRSALKGINQHVKWIRSCIIDINPSGKNQGLPYVAARFYPDRLGVDLNKTLKKNPEDVQHRWVRQARHKV
jgi:hypothetical protein